MKKVWILCIALALLLTGCGHHDKHPEWDGDWTRFGDLMAVESPEDFDPGEYNDALSVNGIWYAVWNCGQEPETIVNAEGEEAAVYDAQIFLLVKECESAAKAEAEVAGWIEREAQNYETGEPREITAAGQNFAFSPLLSGNSDNPYSHGASAFGTRGSLAISAELLCGEAFAGDPETVLTQFLSGIHYGDQEA